MEGSFEADRIYESDSVLLLLEREDVGVEGIVVGVIESIGVDSIKSILISDLSLVGGLSFCFFAFSFLICFLERGGGSSPFTYL